MSLLHLCGICVVPGERVNLKKKIDQDLNLVKVSECLLDSKMHLHRHPINSP